MKKFNLLIVMGITLVLQSCAVIDTQTTPVDRVVKISDTSKNILFVRANNWMVDTFKSSKSVIQFSDKESGSISGRYLLGTVREASQYGAATYVYAGIKIVIKDGASKITVKPESFRYVEGDIYAKYTEKEMNIDINALLSSFANAMKTAEDTNW